MNKYLMLFLLLVFAPVKSEALNFEKLARSIYWTDVDSGVFELTPDIFKSVKDELMLVFDAFLGEEGKARFIHALTVSEGNLTAQFPTNYGIILDQNLDADENISFPGGTTGIPSVDVLCETYSVSKITKISGNTGMYVYVFYFDPKYNPYQLAKIFQDDPSIITAEAGGFMGFGSPPQVVIIRQKDPSGLLMAPYVFQYGWDCFDGCSQVRREYYEVNKTYDENQNEILVTNFVGSVGPLVPTSEGVIFDHINNRAFKKLK